jgi:cyclic pyranopterin monophosphate synthase
MDNRRQPRKGELAMSLTHFDESGRARMVDVSAKADTAREATAAGVVRMRSETLARIRQGAIAKGDVLAVAQVAGVMAAKQTPQMIPMCHTLLLTGVDLTFTLEDGDAGEGCVTITATVRTVGKTGAEMEALAAVSVAALTIYDMCKAIDRAMVIDNVRLMHKSGGKSGDYVREDAGAGSGQP